MQILYAVGHLFSYAWAFLVSALGTTTLSIFLFSFAIPVLIFLATLVINWLQGRKSGIPMKKIIKGSLLSWQTIIPSAIYLLAWILLLSWALTMTAYKDHKALLSRVHDLKQELKEKKINMRKILQAETKQLVSSKLR